MMNILALTSLALATLHMAVVRVSAHGFVSEPPSRQARCRDGQVPGCGDVRYEPQSVEAPQGSFECNGDGARFPELNDDSLWQGHFFTVPPGVDSLSFTWTLTAPHRTTTWQYFVKTEGNALLAEFDSHNTTPPFTVVHSIPLDRFTGRQTVLARWNIGDTINAFYSCVDLLIDNDATQTVVANAAATHLPMSMPVAVPELGLAMAANDTGSANIGPTVNMPLHNVYLFQGPSS